MLAIEYRLSPRVVLVPGDRIRVSGGPYYLLSSGERVSMAARGTFKLVAIEETARGRVTLHAEGPGGHAVLHVAGRRRSRISGLVARPYKIRRVSR
jgi:hypothetical protein